MPLPLPDCARKAAHLRSITVRAYARTDGLWDVEGQLTDVWPEPVPRADGMLAADEPMHSMWLRLTVDRSATIVAVQAATDAGPYDSACGAIAPDYGQLVGVAVARGYRDTIRRLFGRTAAQYHFDLNPRALRDPQTQGLCQGSRFFEHMNAMLFQQRLEG